jgi:hypothetical protein
MISDSALTPVLFFNSSISLRSSTVGVHVMFFLIGFFAMRELVYISERTCQALFFYRVTPRFPRDLNVFPQTQKAATRRLRLWLWQFPTPLC